MAIKNYGLPYMGSKNKIADWVLSYLPDAENFYDLFCGGSAITHCAMERGKYSNYYINDIEPIMPQAFVDAVNGKFKNEDRWISREDFFRLKDTDPYVRLCFSFGNNHKKGYAYSKDLEPVKKALHYAIVFGDYELADSFGIDCHCMDNVEDRRDRRLALGSYLKRNTSRLTDNARENISSSINKSILLANKNRLESLERLERLNAMLFNAKIECLNNSYNEVPIKDNSVVYCDIPYSNSTSYNEQSFNHTKFYDWCENQTQPLFISEYWMPEDRFTCVAEKSKICSFSATNSSKQTVERLFIPKHQESLYSKRSLF